VATAAEDRLNIGIARRQIGLSNMGADMQLLKERAWLARGLQQQPPCHPCHGKRLARRARFCRCEARALRSKLAKVCLRTSSGSRRKSLPSSSKRSKATRKTSGSWLRHPTLVAAHRLAVNQAAAHLQLVHSPDNERVTGGPVMPVAGQQPDANRQGIASGHQPIAVMLDFMNPIRPGWRSLARRWQAGFDNGRQGHFVTMP
jgi:hypothetical protein